ncbi:MAG: MFS transporter [Negativicutes bacterium]|nr:MFS transporter [Negativicutes bacterium]
MRKASVFRLLAYYFMICIVSNFAHPITPTFLQKINCPDSMFGLAFAAMALANFLMASFWGRFGDNYGYVKALGIACVGYAAGQFLFGQANGPVTVLIGRFIAGAFLSGQAVSVMAYLATAAKDNAVNGQYMAIFAALTSIGAAIGYLIGGFLGDLALASWGGNLRIVFYLQVAGLLLIVLISSVLVGETQTVFSKKRLSPAEINPISNIIRSSHLVRGSMLMFLVIVFITSFATNAQDQSFNYFLKAQLNFPPSYNGIFKAVVGIIALTANLTINIWINRHTDSRKSIIPVIAMCGVSLIFLVIAQDQVFFLASALIFYIFNAIYVPIQQALVVRNNSSSKGEISGVFNAAKALGMCTGPLFSGLVFAANPRLPFLAASLAFLLATALSVYNLMQFRKEDRLAPLT